VFIPGSTANYDEEGKHSIPESKAFGQGPEETHQPSIRPQRHENFFGLIYSVYQGFGKA